MPPVTKCDTASQAKPSFNWLFTPFASDMTDLMLQRSEYCDNSNYTLAAPHSYSHKSTSKILQNQEGNPGMYHSTFCSSSSSLPKMDKVSDTGKWSANSNSFSTAEHNANPTHCKDKFSAPLERVSESGPALSELKSEIHKKEGKLTIGSTNMNFLCEMGMSIIGRRKHVLSNFDMNAISPTSW